MDFTDAPQSQSRPLPGRKRSNTRSTHRIRPNHRNYAPSLRVYVDTEAYINPQADGSQRQTLWFGWACFERVESAKRGSPVYESWLYFDSAEQFWAKLSEWAPYNHCTYVYAHNWFYDLAMLSTQTMAEQYGWTITEYVPGNHLLWLTMRNATKTLKFIDTLNYFAMSLARLGNDINVHKTVTEHHPQSIGWWQEYCKQDVIVIREAMHAYFALVIAQDLGAYRPTLAGQAFGAWRHRFMKHDVLILADERVEALERSAYHGGRSEVFYDLPIHTPVYGLDVNSMYPWVMRDNVFPAVKLSKGVRSSVSGLANRLRSELAVARVIVQTNEAIYPFATPDRVLYPTGTFETTLTTPELQYAIDNGHLRQVFEWATYAPEPLFRDYVETLYAVRLQYRDDGNAAFAFLTKILLNSLYGKFGQRGFEWKRCEASDDSPFLDWSGNCEPDGLSMAHRKRFGQAWHREQQLEAFESFPAIAAHVTAYARMALWQLKTEAGHANVFYCDTDSLYVNAEGKQRLAPRISPSELGGLKLESTLLGAQFRSPKDYVMITEACTDRLCDAKHMQWQGKRSHYNEKIKGIRGSALRLSDTVYEQFQFASYDQMLSQGEDGVIVVAPVVKQLNRRNLQSRGAGIGWRTPIQVDESPEASLRLPWQFAAAGKLER